LVGHLRTRAGIVKTEVGNLVAAAGLNVSDWDITAIAREVDAAIENNLSELQGDATWSAEDYAAARAEFGQLEAVDFFETVNEHPARDGVPVLDLPVTGPTRVRRLAAGLAGRLTNACSPSSKLHPAPSTGPYATAPHSQRLDRAVLFAFERIITDRAVGEFFVPAEQIRVRDSGDRRADERCQPEHP
jgi:hypothetical protein